MLRNVMSNEQQLRRQIQSLTDKLAAMGQKRTPAKAKPAKRRRKRQNGGGKLSSDGQMTLSKVEFLATIASQSAAETTGSVDLSPSSMSFLSTLFNSFERIKWLKAHIYYKPAVGTVTDGIVSYGCDWDCTDVKKDRKTISAYTPNKAHAVWQDTQSQPLILPPARLMSRTWYMPESADRLDRMPATLKWALSSGANKTYGELWIAYTVQLQGTRA